MTRSIFLPKAAQKMPHELCKILARSAQWFGGHFRKTHVGGGAPTSPTLAGVKSQWAFTIEDKCGFKACEGSDTLGIRYSSESAEVTTTAMVELAAVALGPPSTPLSTDSGALPPRTDDGITRAAVGRKGTHSDTATASTALVEQSRGASAAVVEDGVSYRYSVRA